ncbi:MAG: hypothetical protein J6S18_02420, partial [Oscillospiraceae bacterium]|nr:hypothetical protein [Oscillospiraceae bacterium]
MSNKLSGKALVIQLTRDHIRVAKMQLGAKPQLICDTKVATPEGAVEDGLIRDMGALTDALKTILAAPDFKGTRKVVFALCTTLTLSEKVTVPAVKGQKMEKIMDANMDMYFPVGVSDYHITKLELGRSTDEHGVANVIMQLWAIPKSLLVHYYELAAACGLHILAIDYCGNSHACVAGATFLEPKPEKVKKSKKKKAAAEEEPVEEEAPAADPVSVYLMAEPEMMIMTFVEKGQVRMQRSFLCGYDIDSALSEAMMVIDYYRSIDDDRYAPMEIIVCGTMADDMYFDEQVEMILGLPTRVQESAHAPGWCCCIGAAQTELDFGSPELMGKKKKSLGTTWHYGVVLVGGAAAVFSIMMLMASKMTWNNEITALQDTEMMLRIQSAQGKKAAEEYSDYAAKYQSFSSDWTNVFASLRTYNDNLVLILQEIEELLPEQTFVETIDIQADGMSLQFSCTDKEEAAYLLMALRDMKYATLETISNLSGTTGKVGRDDVEAPPTEGGKMEDAVMEAINSGQLSMGEAMPIYGALCQEQMDRLSSA